MVTSRKHSTTGCYGVLLRIPMQVEQADVDGNRLPRVPPGKGDTERIRFRRAEGELVMPP